MRIRYALISALLLLFVSCDKSNIGDFASREQEDGKLVSADMTDSDPADEALSEALEWLEPGKFVESTGFELGLFLDAIDVEAVGLKIDCYRIKYHSRDNVGKDIILEGDVAYAHNPFSSGTRYLESVSLFHTALYTADCSSTHYEDLIIPARTIHNALLVHPIYQGSGIDKGKHDIIPSEGLLKARQAIDCELAALEFIQQKEGVQMIKNFRTDNICISAGANACLATHYLLEQDPVLSQVNKEKIHLAGTCMCEGPTTFSAMLPQFLTAKFYSSTKFFTMLACLVGSYDTWKGIPRGDGTCYLEGVEVEDFFSEEFLAAKALDGDGNTLDMGMIDFFKAGDMNHFGGKVPEGLTLENMLAPGMYNGDGSLNVEYPPLKALLEAMGRNDVAISGWAPQAALCFCHSLDDELVPYSLIYDTWYDLSANGRRSNVRLKTVAGLGHDDGNKVFAVLQYLISDFPAI